MRGFFAFWGIMFRPVGYRLNFWLSLEIMNFNLFEDTANSRPRFNGPNLTPPTP
jgi:hypothetical protein